MRSLWLVDAYNVLRVNLAEVLRADPGADEEGTGWWRAERRSLLERLAARLAEPAAEVCLVFDARHLAEAQEGPGSGAPGECHGPRVRSVFAPSADDWILATLRQRRDELPGIRVVTADRPLANRARRLGAEVVETSRFLALCASPGDPIRPGL